MRSPVGRHEQRGGVVLAGHPTLGLRKYIAPTSCACAAVVKVRGVDEATLGLAASSNVMATVATRPSLRTIGIYHQRLAISTSRNGRSRGDLTPAWVSVLSHCG